MLYRLYRPQSFADVVGQEHVIRTLQGAFRNDRIGHAYLFAGPRGTGKTTIARILAKALNCEKRGKGGEPCNECDPCQAVNENRSLDLIEIDGASNGRVDEIRALKESAGVAATGGGYKVFLIDEVHMVTKEAFNALLKILEEPPAHVIFIFATTDPQKIPATILSRIQRFDFRKLTDAEVTEKLTQIAKSEKLSIDPAALAAMAAASDGALRDAEVMLSKVISALGTKDKVTAEQAAELLGLIPIAYHAELLSNLVDNNRTAALSVVAKTVEGGINSEQFAKEFLEYLRKVLLYKIDPSLAKGEQFGVPADKLAGLDVKRLTAMVLKFTDARAEVKFSPIPQLPLELAVVELTV